MVEYAPGTCLCHNRSILSRAAKKFIRRFRRLTQIKRNLPEICANLVIRGQPLLPAMTRRVQAFRRPTVQGSRFRALRVLRGQQSGLVSVVSLTNITPEAFLLRLLTFGTEAVPLPDTASCLRDFVFNLFRRSHRRNHPWPRSPNC